jgi:hypothetical protein
VKEFQSWLFREEHFNQVQHDADIAQLKSEWPEFSGRQHDALCTLPRYLAEDASPVLGDCTAQMHWLSSNGERQQAALSVLRLIGCQQKLGGAAELVSRVAAFVEDSTKVCGFFSDEHPEYE